MSEKKEDSEKKQDAESEVKLRPDEWMLKPCEWYNEEYMDCTSLRGRFNQYFVYGEYLDCSQWKTDCENCKKWETSEDEEAFKALVASETKRRMERLTPHYRNNVWTKREKPPEDWNKPLPDWLDKQQQNTFLDYKQKSLETGNVNDLDMKLPFCTIM